jgi:hypothetical protein
MRRAAGPRPAESLHGDTSLRTMICCAVHRDRHVIPNGPFIDEVSTSLETYSHYSSIYSRAKSLGKYVVLNPGTNIDPRSFNIAYKIVALEPPLEEYVNFSYLLLCGARQGVYNRSKHAAGQGGLRRTEGRRKRQQARLRMRQSRQAADRRPGLLLLEPLFNDSHLPFFQRL